MIDDALLSSLWCPACQSGGLTPPPGLDRRGPDQDGAPLWCEACRATFPVRYGFPVLIPEGALTGPEWQLWRDHLEKFQARREARIRNPAEPITRLAERTDAQPAFADFVGIARGSVLDVGCGPGKFRFHLDSEGVRYVGLDPIYLPDVRDFPFVQGLAEYIPFRDGTFTDVVVLAALDHFRDPDRFLDEARRVLALGGRLHLLQSVHEVRGPVSAIKVVAHKLKDALEDRRTASHGRDVPKHLEEFTHRSVLARMSRGFDVVSSERYSATWYAPDKLFLTFEPREAAGRTERPLARSA